MSLWPLLQSSPKSSSSQLVLPTFKCVLQQLITVISKSPSLSSQPVFTLFTTTLMSNLAASSTLALTSTSYVVVHHPGSPLNHPLPPPSITSCLASTSIISTVLFHLDRSWVSLVFICSMPTSVTSVENCVARTHNLMWVETYVTIYSVYFHYHGRLSFPYHYLPSFLFGVMLLFLFYVALHFGYPTTLPYFQHCCIMHVYLNTLFNCSDMSVKDWSSIL